MESPSQSLPSHLTALPGAERRPELSRRTLIASAAGLVASAALPHVAHAAAKPAEKQVPGIYRRKVGAFEITALSDGYLDVPNDYWQGIERTAVEKAEADAFLPSNGKIRIGVTSYLVNTGRSLVLVDSGAASFFGPTAGRLSESLAAAGVTPASIDVILLTHMHPDHVGAMIEGSSAIFPNAVVHVAETEHKFWIDDTQVAKAPDFAKPWFKIGQTVSAAYKPRLNLFSGEKEIVPGFTGVSLPGHTPGHTGYRITSEGESLLLWGDVCGVAAVQFQHPDAGLVFDVDGQTGRVSRKRILDVAATDRILVAGAHLPFPSFGHVEKSGPAYRWVADEWQFM